MSDNDPSTPKKIVVIAVVHHISWATARAGPSKHMRGLVGTVDVVVVVAAVHHISWAAVRAGPSKGVGRLMGRAERPIQSPHLMGSGPGWPVKRRVPPHGPGGAAHTEPTSHGPRPDPAHHISRGWAAARPGPSKLQRMGRGPAQPITLSNCHGPVRPGPSNFQKSRPGPARPITFSKVSARPGPAQTNGP